MDDLIARITEVMNLSDNSGKGLALTGKGYVLLHNIRAELSQAVALTDAEEVALYRMDSQREGRWPVVFFNASDYDTLRALVTRLTAASDGGGKGETK